MSGFIESKIMPVAGIIASNRYLQSIRDGLIFTMPFIMVGSVFLIITNLPIPGFNDLMISLLGENWKGILNTPARATFDMMAIIATVAIATSLAKKYSIDGLYPGMTALSVFIISTPLSILQDKVLVEKALSLNYTSSKGLFVGIMCALITVEIFKFTKDRNLAIKMPDSVPDAVAKSFSALIPAMLCVFIFWLIRTFLSFTSFDNIHTLLQQFIGQPLGVLSGSLWGLSIGLIVQQLLWAIGMHGSSLVMVGLRPSLLQLLDENRIAFEAGKEMPNIINQAFYDLFIQGIGGSGCTLGLSIALLLFIRSKQLKELGTLAFVPSLFNINEPLSFAIPIVLNPLLIIPFVIAPLVTLWISYFAMATGLVAMTNGVLIPWTTPPIISGFLATGSISGGILQLVNIIITGFIYYPFITMWDKTKLKEEGTN